jgi:hypothetical protein
MPDFGGRHRAGRHVRQTWGDSAMLRQAFREATLRAGKRLKRVSRVAASDRPVTQIYRVPSDQTVRLRTNRRRALMTVAEGFAAEDVMDCEAQQNFIGIAIPGPLGSVECFLVPMDEAIERLRCAHRSWLAQHPGGTSDVRAIWFDAPAGSGRFL